MTGATRSSSRPMGLRISWISPTALTAKLYPRVQLLRPRPLACVGASSDLTYPTDTAIPVDLRPGPFDLLTTSTESATPLDGTADQDARTTGYVYAIGSNELGWALGTPLETIVDVGGTGHLNVTTTTLYNAAGQLTARILPDNPSGGDAHETDFIYYTADSSASDPVCQSTPQYAGQVCKRKPAANRRSVRTSPSFIPSRTTCTANPK